MNRRSFISRAGATGLAIATIPGIVDSMTVQALAGGDKGLDALLAETDSVLVLIQMMGGNDGLNTVVPIENDKYYAGRPNIAIPKNKTLGLTSTLGLHPALAGFKALYDDEKLAIVQGVTYPNPDRSHFRGTDIWLTATDANVFGTTGWVGRYLGLSAPNFPTVLPEHPLAVQVGTSLSLGLLSTNGPMGVSFRDPDEFYRLVNTGGAIEEVPSSVQGDTPAGREVAFMRSIARAADVYAGIIKTAADAATSATATYPTTDIGAKLRVVSQLIRGGLKTRVYLISWANNNFDTHANQVAGDDPTTGAHANLLRELGDAVKVFLDDMQATGHGDRVSGMTFSEFGRRVAENGSLGTDHGTAAPLFVFGAKVNGGKVYGKDPNLEELDDRGDLLMDMDFREIYASVLLQWFGAQRTEAETVLYRDFAPNAPQLFGSPTALEHDGAPITIRSITPNPANGPVAIHVDMPASSEGHVIVRNIAGQHMITSVIEPWSGVAQLDVSTLPPSTYIVTTVVGSSTRHTTLTVTR